MVKKIARTVVVITLFFVVQGTRPVQSAQAEESSWNDLTDDGSRQSLFESEVKPAKLKEEQELGTPSTTTLNIPLDFVFPDDARRDKIKGQDRINSIFGVDISHYTGTKIRFRDFRLQQVLFVYAKATQGVSYKDSLFARYWSDLEQYLSLGESKRLYRGAYHFLTAGDAGKAQADRFVDYVELHGGFRADDMPPCVDLEWDRTSSNPDRWKGTSPDEILKKTKEWLKQVELRTNRKPMIYTAIAFWNDHAIPLQRISEFADYPIWIADYSRSHKAAEKPSAFGDRKHDLWQFAEDARVETGYAGGVLDANIYYGDIAKFKADFGLPQ